MSHHTDNHLREACQAALDAFKSISKPEFMEIQSKLEFCIGSYDFDHNPTGLVEFGKTALDKLNEFKRLNPRKVNKTVIDNLSRSLSGR